MQRLNLSSELRHLIRERVISGQLAAGTRLNEVHLAEEFKVSRTPLREALFGLVKDQLVVEIPRRGFFVAELSVAEIRELYVIRQILDPEALRYAGIPDQETLEKLRELNTRIANAKSATRIVELDDEWHLLLIEGCNNQILLDLVKQHMIRTRRYELAYMSVHKNVGVATDEHDLIVGALKKRKLALACKYLKQNMTSAESPLIEWVRGINQEKT
ncbi:MAG: GntR family transcriptional regulator [Pirellulaceae bacterium]